MKKIIGVIMFCLCNVIMATETMQVKVEFLVQGSALNMGAESSMAMYSAGNKNVSRNMVLLNKQVSPLLRERGEDSTPIHCGPSDLDWVNKDLNIGFVTEDNQDFVIIKGYMESTPWVNDCGDPSKAISRNVYAEKQQEHLDVNNKFSIKIGESVWWKLNSQKLPTVIKVTRLK